MAHFGMVSLCSTDLGFLGSERVKPLSESQFKSVKKTFELLKKT